MFKTVQTALLLLGATTEAVNVANSAVSQDITINIDSSGSGGSDSTDANLQWTFEQPNDAEEYNARAKFLWVMKKLVETWG